MKIASWNVNSLKVRLDQVLTWLNENEIDVLALQETKLQDQDFPLEPFTKANYQVVYTGQKTYNGVAILSRLPLQEIETELPGVSPEQKRILAVSLGTLRIINLYVPNGQSVDSVKYLYKLDWLEKLRSYLAEQLRLYPELVVLGDFNIAPEDKDVYSPEKLEGQILVSAKERAAFMQILELGFHDSFRLFSTEAEAFSWWDYRQAAFRRNLGLRIDHILINQALKERCIASFIDKRPRAWERPSDHAPVCMILA